MPRAAATPRKASRPKRDPWDTPAMRQYTTFKKQHPGCVLFFRMGDFYEMFGADAERVGGALGLTISSRSSPIPMAGVPHHQLANYLRRAIDAGFRVAVVDQVQDPRDAKGVVDRAVTQVVTPGTLVDESLLDGGASVHLGAVCFLDDTLAGAAVVELSTGSFVVFDAAPARVAEELARLGVRELLYAATTGGEPPARVAQLCAQIGAQPTGRAGWHFRREETLEAIRDQYKVGGVEGFGLDAGSPSTAACGAVLRYLRQTQVVGRGASDAASGSEFQRQPTTLDHLSPPRTLDDGSVCRLDAVSLRALEIEQTIRGDSDGLNGSLLGVFLRSDHGPRCVVRTAMGKRLIRAWLTRPLRDVGAIRARQDAVGVLVDDTALGGALGERLDGVVDIARIAGRLALGRATPRDLVGLGRTLSGAGELAETIAQSPALRAQHGRAAALAAELTPIGEHITAACVDDPPAHLRAGGLIRGGVDNELDEARSLERDAGAWLADYQSRLIAEHDLPSLKVGFNRVFGYYIELPAAQAQRAPDILTRKQTLKNAERYITPELKVFEEKVTTAESRALSRERTLFDGLCARAREHLAAISALAEAIGELDVLLGLGEKARARGWVRPEMVDEPVLDIHGGRHPVLDELLGHKFVPNDCSLRTSESPEPVALLTGPNMAGKSTYIRQNALLAVLAMAGSFVPADRATIGVADRIFTRVGADDALHRGQSTFMVEMTETATILNNATGLSLVVLDEIGRGTSTLDGLSLAWAIVEFLAGQEETREGSADQQSSRAANPDCADDASGSGGGSPRVLFATHYHELTDLPQRLPGRVRNLQVAVNEWTNAQGVSEIVFLHSIRPGRADRSYGVHVAELAGVPRGVVERARAVLATLSVEQAGRVETAAVPAASAPSGQMGLFTEFVSHPAVDRLREIRLESMTPIEAFDALRVLKEEVEKK